MPAVVTTVANADTPQDYGHPNEHFVWPYDLTEDDATTGLAYDYGDAALTAPRPWEFETTESFEALKNDAPGKEGVYEVKFRNDPMFRPSNDQASIVPAPGSVDLIEPRDTPYYAPSVNRIISSDGPVSGTPDETYTGTRAEIGRAEVGINGPVTGDTGYSWQLAQSLQQAYAQAYSDQAATASLVASV